jgi:hypothetical protein
MALRWAGAGILASALLLAGTAPAGAEDFSGHWHLIFYGRCANAPANWAACAALQGPARFAIFGRTGTVLTVRGVGDYISDRAGRYTVRFWTTVTEEVPGAHRPQQCTDALVFDGVFNGTCREHGGGRGHIAPGRTGMPDFWQDVTHGVWDGSPPAPFVTTVPTDTFNPACPGRLDTKHFLALFGIRRAPAGITASVVLTRRR